LCIRYKLAVDDVAGVEEEIERTAPWRSKYRRGLKWSQRAPKRATGIPRYIDNGIHIHGLESQFALSDSSLHLVSSGGGIILTLDLNQYIIMSGPSTPNGIAPPPKQLSSRLMTMKVQRPGDTTRIGLTIIVYATSFREPPFTNH
jgi:hypothetical protein